MVRGVAWADDYQPITSADAAATALIPMIPAEGKTGSQDPELLENAVTDQGSPQGTNPPLGVSEVAAWGGRFVQKAAPPSLLVPPSHGGVLSPGL